MNILEKSIQAEGSVGALATAIGVKQNVISNWRARNSVPDGWEKFLQLKYNSDVALLHSVCPETTEQAPA